jgi:hypothetical protein
VKHGLRGATAFFDKIGLRLSRSVIFRVTVAAALFALIILFVPLGAQRSVRLDTPEGAAALEKGAEAYLRQAARLLGDRFDESFYRSAVATRLSRYRAFPVPSEDRQNPPSRECFEILDAGDGVAEALAFLDEIDPGGGVEDVSFSADVFYVAGNPINMLADRLVGIDPPTPFAGQARLRDPATFPVSCGFGFLFSLVSLAAAAASASSPLGVAVGGGLSTCREFFCGLTRSLSLLSVPPFFGPAPVRSGGSFFPVHTPRNENKIAVLLL